MKRLGKAYSVHVYPGATQAFLRSQAEGANGAATAAAWPAAIQFLEAGFYGEDDARVMPTVKRAQATMKRLGKAYDVHVYPGATQAFLRSQAEGANGAATAAAWPAAIQFLQECLKGE